jgi:hypothetical protein
MPQRALENAMARIARLRSRDPEVRITELETALREIDAGLSEYGEAYSDAHRGPYPRPHRGVFRSR